MKLLDLFCGAGGAAVGYSRAGFDEIVGVDNAPQKNYPFEFMQADVYELEPAFLQEFDLIHASPPCQAYSSMRGIWNKWQREGIRSSMIEPDPQSVPKTRNLLEESGMPYIIENVANAPLRDPLVLCGTMFPGLRVIRHRLFESLFDLQSPRPCQSPHPIMTRLRGDHPMKRRMIDLWAWYIKSSDPNPPKDALADAMGIDWMNGKELSQAIPPVYTYWIGKQILEGDKLAEWRPYDAFGCAAGAGAQHSAGFVGAAGRG